MNGARKRRRHLVSRHELAEAYETRYGAAVAEYGLAVRDLVESCHGISAVDTWSTLAGQIWRNSPERDRKRRMLSRQFTVESKGPAWSTVRLLVRHLLPDDRQEAELTRLRALYERSRCRPAPSTGQQPETMIADLLRQNANLRRANVELLRQNAELRQAAADRRLKTAGRAVESARLPVRPEQPRGPGRAGSRPAWDGSSADVPPRPDRPQDGPAREVRRNTGRFQTATPPTGPPDPRRRPARLDTTAIGRTGSGAKDAEQWLAALWSHPHQHQQPQPQPQRKQSLGGQPQPPGLPSQPPVGRPRGGQASARRWNSAQQPPGGVSRFRSGPGTSRDPLSPP